jgi:hypothetical protein
MGQGVRRESDMSEPLFHLFGEFNEYVIVNPLLEGTAWGVHRRATDVPSIESAFLDGQEEPELSLADDPKAGMLFSEDRVVYKIKHAYGAGVVDHRGAVKQGQIGSANGRPGRAAMRSLRTAPPPHTFLGCLLAAADDGRCVKAATIAGHDADDANVFARPHMRVVRLRELVEINVDGQEWCPSPKSHPAVKWSKPSLRTKCGRPDERRPGAREQPVLRQ